MAMIWIIIIHAWDQIKQYQTGNIRRDLAKKLLWEELYLNLFGGETFGQIGFCGENITYVDLTYVEQNWIIQMKKNVIRCYEKNTLWFMKLVQQSPANKTIFYTSVSICPYAFSRGYLFQFFSSPNHQISYKVGRFLKISNKNDLAKSNSWLRLAKQGKMQNSTESSLMR